MENIYKPFCSFAANPLKPSRCSIKFLLKERRKKKRKKEKGPMNYLLVSCMILGTAATVRAYRGFRSSCKVLL
jgi:hypothetical protein